MYIHTYIYICILCTYCTIIYHATIAAVPATTIPTATIIHHH